MLTIGVEASSAPDWDCEEGHKVEECEETPIKSTSSNSIEYLLELFVLGK